MTVPAHRELRVGNLNTIVNEVAEVVGVFGRPCGKRYSGDRMIATLAPYPEMRDSGLAGLGEVPRHWDVRRLKNVCRLNYGDSLGSNSRSSGTVAVFGSNGQIGWHNVANTKDPCIVVGRKGSFGKINYVEDSVFAIDATFFVDERSSTADLRWLYYCLEWLGLDKVTKDSAIPGLDRQDAYTRRLVTPPRSEQTDIARFLDDADRRIQRYIRAKERLIELLEEQKQAIIDEAVTGQIDVRTGRPYPAYKDSEVEWLGEVPKHWEVQSLGTFGRFFKGSGGIKADETEQGVPCVRYGDLYTRHQYHVTESKACVAHHRAGTYTPVRYGDVLFAGSGETLEEIGKSAVNLIRGSAVCGGDVIVFRPATNVDAEFIGSSTDCRQAASQKARMGEPLR